MIKLILCTVVAMLISGQMVSGETLVEDKEQNQSQDYSKTDSPPEAKSSCPTENEISPYTRVVVFQSENAALILQSSIRELRRKDTGGIIKLVSMHHLAEETFYRAVENALFGCDTILCEGSTSEERKKPSENIEFQYGRKYEVEIAKLLGLQRQTEWEDKVMKDKRWIYADRPEEEFEHYVIKNNLVLFPESRKKFIDELAEINSKKLPSEELESVKTQIKLSMFNSLTHFKREECCFGWIPEEERKQIQHFVHTLRDKVIFDKLKPQIQQNPQAKIAMLYGARHFMDLEPMIVGELGYEAYSVSWIDVMSQKLPKGLVRRVEKPVE